MPALSQNLTFTVNSSTSVLLDYPNTGTTALLYNSNRIKGDGYFGGSDGFHTVQLQVTNFIGKVQVQGTLSTSPAEADWFTVKLGVNSFTVDTTGLVSESSISSVDYTQASTDIKSYNFSGNYVWLRAKVSNWTQGAVNSISINY